MLSLFTEPVAHFIPVLMLSKTYEKTFLIIETKLKYNINVKLGVVLSTSCTSSNTNITKNEEKIKSA